MHILGTSHSGGYSQEAVVYALKNCNYRLIDTAKRYGCEEFLQYAIHVSQFYMLFSEIYIKILQNLGRTLYKLVTILNLVYKPY